MTDSTPVALYLEKAVEDAFSVFLEANPNDEEPEHFAARALDDAGVREAVKALDKAATELENCHANVLKANNPDCGCPTATIARECRSALAALIGTKETNDGE